MTDQYKEQYKKETEQIHAPAELIAKTKAAMREEEARIRREPALQTAEPKAQGIPAASGQTTVPANGRRYFKRFDARKWAYPLTAAAALLILVSVSLTMSGLNSKDKSMSGAPQMDAGAVEETAAGGALSDGADSDGGMADAGAVAETEEAAMETAETEEAFLDEMVSAEADMEASLTAEIEDLTKTAGMAENAMFDSAELSEVEDKILAEKSEFKETERTKAQKKLYDAERSMADDAAAFAENRAASGGAVGTESITIERVTKKPDFCEKRGTQTHIYEGEVFQVAEEENGWAAYVETKDGDGYVIRGAAADVEAFLEAGYRKLAEEK